MTQTKKQIDNRESHNEIQNETLDEGSNAVATAIDALKRSTMGSGNGVGFEGRHISKFDRYQWKSNYYSKQMCLCY